jgi:hypothetical protein
MNNYLVNCDYIQERNANYERRKAIEELFEPDPEQNFPNANGNVSHELVIDLQFDRLKQEGKMKDTLEVSLEVDRRIYFEGIEDWFVVGHVSEITQKEALAEWQGLPGLFRIVKSDLNKCERCWKRNAKETLCERCQKVLPTMGEE